MIKIALLTPVWQRPELTRLYFENVKRITQYKTDQFSVTPIIALSETWCENMCKEFGFRYVFVDNNPLGAKMNAALKEVITESFDWLITQGSDDFIEPTFLDEYLPHFKTKKAFGIASVNVLNQQTKEQKVWSIGYAFGALRAIRFDVVRVASITKDGFAGLWPKHLNKALDFYSAERLEQKTGTRIEVVEIKTRLWDVKSDTSINRWGKIKGHVINTPLNRLPKEIVKIYQLPA